MLTLHRRASGEAYTTVQPNNPSPLSKLATLWGRATVESLFNGNYFREELIPPAAHDNVFLLNGKGYIIVRPGSTPTISGGNLRTAVQSGLTKLDAADSVCVIIPHGYYHLGVISDTNVASTSLYINKSHIHFVGLGNPVIEAQCNSQYTATVVITTGIEDVSFTNLTVKGTSSYTGVVDASYPVACRIKTPASSIVFRNTSLQIEGSVKPLTVGETINAEFSDCEFYAGAFWEADFGGKIDSSCVFGTDPFKDANILASAFVDNMVVDSWVTNSVSPNATILSPATLYKIQGNFPTSVRSAVNVNTDNVVALGEVSDNVAVDAKNAVLFTLSVAAAGITDITPSNLNVHPLNLRITKPVDNSITIPLAGCTGVVYTQGILPESGVFDVYIEQIGNDWFMVIGDVWAQPGA